MNDQEEMISVKLRVFLLFETILLTLLTLHVNNFLSFYYNDF